MLQRISKRTKAVRSLIQEVVGLSPYEKRLLDMLKTGGASAEKRMYKLSKRRVSFCLIICSLLIIVLMGMHVLLLMLIAWYPHQSSEEA
jgi:hypothetical protein